MNLNESVIPNQSESTCSFLLEFDWPEHIEKVVRRLMWLELSEAAGDQRIEIEEDVELADHISAQLCWLIAVSPDSPSAVLHALAYNVKSQALLERIAENPHAAEETLRMLAEYDSPKIRCAVVSNSKSPADLLAKLCSDECVDVRYSLAEDPNLAEELLRILAEDDNCYVAARARRSIKRAKPAQPAILGFKHNAASADALERKRRFG